MLGWGLAAVSSSGQGPLELSGKALHLQENESKKWWKVTVDFAEMSLKNAHTELEQHFDDTEYVIVCQPPNGIKEALFVDKYNAKKKV